MVLDTLQMARQMHPGQRNGLDALCKRYSVDNSHRDLHGALLDADLLLEVYLAMTGGQGALDARRRRAGGGDTATIEAREAPARRRSSCARRTPTSWAHTSARSRRSTRRAAARRSGAAFEPDAAALMTSTLSQAFARNFLGHAPGWYKLTIVGFLVVNPLLLILAGPAVTGWALLARVHLHAGDGAALLSAAAGRPARDPVRAHRAHDGRGRLPRSDCGRSR